MPTPAAKKKAELAKKAAAKKKAELAKKAAAKKKAELAKKVAAKKAADKKKAELAKKAAAKKIEDARKAAARAKLEAKRAADAARKKAQREKEQERRRLAAEKKKAQAARAKELALIAKEKAKEKARVAAEKAAARAAKEQERIAAREAKEAARKAAAEAKEAARLAALRRKPEPPPKATHEKIEFLDGIYATNHFDHKFLASQRDLLHQMRAIRTNQANRLEDEANALIEDVEMGDVQFDEEGGEGDTMVVERERDLVLSAEARHEIEEIDAALERIRVGEYGYSIHSGLPIPRERLKAIPWTQESVQERVGGIGRR
ncbi:MAG: TraR/DksA family transcriptional regulator [Actinomycetota bacterium]